MAYAYAYTQGWFDFTAMMHPRRHGAELDKLARTAPSAPVARWDVYLRARR